MIDYKNYVKFSENIETKRDAINWCFEDFFYVLRDAAAKQDGIDLKELCYCSGLTENNIKTLLFSPAQEDRMCNLMRLAYCLGYRIKLEKIEE
jgi:hypothetical protein